VKKVAPYSRGGKY